MVKKIKTCSMCGVAKPLNVQYFQRNQSTNTGGKKYFRPECKVCQNKEARGKAAAVKLYMKSKGFANMKEYKEARPPLGTPCDNCARDTKRLVFDHCHETFVHRGWLCDNCNRSIGMLGDDEAGLLSALKYLQKKEWRII